MKMTAQNTRKIRASGRVFADRMGLGWLIAAAVFLFNPCVNIIDVLPDFFGVVFLINGLRKWGDLCPGISDAIKGLEKLKWFMLVKAVCMILVPLNDDTFVLVMTLGFAVIEMIYLYPAIGRIFDGFEYFATRFQSRAVYKNYKNVSAVTYIFCVGKAILTVLPEFCSLSDYEYDGYVTSGVQIDFAHYKYALLFISLFLVTLMGVMWLINVIPYISRIKREDDFISRVFEQYDNEVLSNNGLMLCRSLKSAFTLIAAGTFFVINIWVDELNIIPSFIGAVFLIFAASKFKKLSETAKPMFVSSIMYLICSAGSYALSVIFSLNYSLTDVMYRFEAYDLYNLTRVGTALEYISQFSVIFFTLRELRAMIYRYLSPDAKVTDKRVANIILGGDKELDRKFIISIVLFVISFALNFALSMFRAEINSVLSEFWWIPLIMTTIWVVYQKFSVSTLYDQIEYKNI